MPNCLQRNGSDNGKPNVTASSASCIPAIMNISLPLAILCCVVFRASGQDAGPTKPLVEANQRVRFGAKLGLNVSNVNFNRGFPTPSVPVQTTWQAGFVGGGLLQVPIHNKFSFQQEYLYAQMQGKVKNTDTEYTFSYLSFPILFKYDVLKRISLLAGAQFDLLIDAHQKVGGVRASITHDVEERSIGATAGLEYSVLPKLSFTARYMHGLNNIGIGQRSAVTEFKYELVQLTADVKF
jgi:hypothetical protein